MKVPLKNYTQLHLEFRDCIMSMGGNMKRLSKFNQMLGKQIIIGDGVFGSLVQHELGQNIISDELNLSNKGFVEKIYREYARNGADFLTTNTFGATKLKLAEVGLENEFENINRNGVELAGKIANEFNVFVGGNLGPLGKLIEPLGELTFDDAVKNFADQAIILEQYGADFILIETIPEIQEYRAAVIGALSCVKIPVIASMSFPNDDLTLSGTNGSVFAVISEFPGLRGIGSNCGNSLENMKKVMEKICKISPLPLICQANAGIPVLENGKTVFKVKPSELADFMEDIYMLGVSIIGSCCGSTPEFTEKLAKKFKGRPVLPRNTNESLTLATRTTIRKISKDKIFIVGERINPTGRKKLRHELEQGILTTLRKDAIEQEQMGADALDINIEMAGMNETLLKAVITGIQDNIGIPLFIDSLNINFIETFGKLYPGKGVINSISVEEHRMNSLLPLAKKYNMGFIALLIDEEGIPSTMEKRVQLAEIIVSRANEIGINTKNIIFDPLVLNAGAEVEKVPVTLDTISELKKRFPLNKIIMGLSNVSYGLPNREIVNLSFLALGVSRGVDMVIANPLQDSLRHSLMALNFLKTGSKENLSKFTEYFSEVKYKVETEEIRQKHSLIDYILMGDSDGAINEVSDMLEREEPGSIVETYIIPAMNEMGKRYREKKCFLPQLMGAGEAVKSILPIIKKRLKQSGNFDRDITIILASVKGDIHDIGKNIVGNILESFNYKVIDLGKDVAAEKIVNEAIENKSHIIGLSALMTTTLPSMYETIGIIKTEPSLREAVIFIGGAVVTREIANENGVYYSKDGMDMVNKIRAAFPFKQLQQES